MTYLSDAPHQSDARAYTPGGLVGRNDLVDLERQHRQLKLLRELQDARAAQDNAPHHDRLDVAHASAQPPQLLELPARGPVIWRGGAAGPASEPTTKQHHSSGAIRHPALADGALRSSRRTPSIHTLLEIVRASSSATAASSSSLSSSNAVAVHAQTRALVSLGSSHVRRPTAAAAIAMRHDDAPSRGSSSLTSPPAVASSSGTQARTGTSSSPTLVPFPGTTSPSAAQQQRLHALHQQPLRRGKWTKAEEEFAAATIQYFCSGLLNLQFGTLLRGFLAQQLHCHPMRISKKLLPGTTFCGVEISRKLGRRAYSPRWCDSPEATQQKLDAETHLSALRTAFLASLDHEADESDERPSDATSRSAATASPDCPEDSRRLHASRESVKSETRRAGSPTYLDEQQQQQQQQSGLYSARVGPQAQQQPPTSGRKRTRDDWTVAEREHHHTHPQRHAPFARHHHLPQQQQPQQYGYLAHQPPQPSARRALGPPHASSSSGWYPVRPATTLAPSQTANPHQQQQQQHHHQQHTGMSNYHRARTAMHPHAMAFHPQQQQQQHVPDRYERPSPSFGEQRGSSGSMEAPSVRSAAPLLPSLRASLQRASSATAATTTAAAAARAATTSYTRSHEHRF